MGEPLQTAMEEWRVIQQQRHHDVSWTACSVLRFDLSSERLGYYLSVLHNKRISSEFVRIVCCLCGPENVGVIPINGAQLHRKRGARLRKLRKEGFKKGFNCGWTF